MYTFGDSICIFFGALTMLTGYMCAGIWIYRRALIAWHELRRRHYESKVEADRAKIHASETSLELILHGGATPQEADRTTLWS
jgi:hypothetical protein